MSADIKVFASIIEETATSQINRIASIDAFKDSKIRIMPDVHAGKGCVCGFTADLGRKVVPNLVGVDIGCGVLCVNIGKNDIDLKKFDKIVHKKIPCGMEVNQFILSDISEFYDECDPDKCHIAFDQGTLKYFKQSMGSIGSGNHFLSIERSSDGTNYLVVHTGSRNLGKQVCEVWQKTAVKHQLDDSIPSLDEMIKETKRKCYENGERSGIHKKLIEVKHQWKKMRDAISGNEDLAYLEGDDKTHYVEDMRLCQKWAAFNRKTIAQRVCDSYGVDMLSSFDTIHNYLGDDNIIRKSAISARRGEKVIIPMNMRDGSLICIGKGNEDWNFSAPHGAGRIMSRARAKQKLNLTDFKRSMKGIYTTSVCQSTIDEAPDAYKPMETIMEEIKDTVDIVDVIKPIYNFKAAI